MNKKSIIEIFNTIKEKSGVKRFVFKCWSNKGNTTKMYAKNIILISKELYNFNENQIKYIIAHELSHIEFYNAKLTRGEVLNLNKNSMESIKCKIKSILNETFCDLRAKKVSEISMEQVTKYFYDNAKRHPINENAQKCLADGYFKSTIRGVLVKKYYNSFISKQIDINQFEEDVFNYYNEANKDINMKLEDKLIIRNVIETYYKDYFNLNDL